jgi:hypothetical protein
MTQDRDETLKLIRRHLRAKEGGIGRQIVGYGYFAPFHLRLEEVRDDNERINALVYRDSLDDETPGHWVRKNRRVLDDFILLAWPDPRHADDDDVLEFAKRWGVLGLCEHNLPYTHTLDDLSTGPSVHLSAVKSPMSYPERRCERVRKTETIEYDDTKLERQTGECIEYIGAWRLFAERAVLLLELAASLRSRTDPPDKEKTRRVLVRRLNKWLDMANVGVVCGDTATGEWPSGLQVRIATRGGLFGVLAVQLLLATTLTELLFTCAACGTIFNAAPAERPRRGERAFCSKCGRKAAMRFASQDYRDRKKERHFSS